MSQTQLLGVPAGHRPQPFPDEVAAPEVAALRRARPTDLDAFQGLVRRLSVETSGNRFFSPATRLPSRQARLLVSADHSRGAWLALQGAQVVGHACWTRTSPTTAELAVVVEDRLQGRGLGRSLVRAAVADAGAAGIRQLEMVVQPDNRRVVEVIRRAWPSAAVAHGPGTLTFRVPVPDGS